MKNIKLKFSYFVLICTLFISAQLSLAQSLFQTHLLKTEVLKTSLGTLKVNLYTNKPYSDALTVNKKNDYEYVILMPETANTSTTGPVYNTVTDIVRNVNVKTQQYEGNIKGYTKIVINTTKPIEINAQIKVITPTETKISDKDYKELLAQASSKQSAKSKVQAPVKKQQPTVAKPKETTKIAQAHVKKVAEKVQKPKVEKKIQPQKTVTKTETKPVKPVQPVEKPTTTVEKPQPKPPVPQDVVNKTDIAQHPDVVTPQEPKTTTQIAPEPKPIQAPAKLTKIQKAKKLVKKGLKFADENTYSLAGLAALLLLLILIARKLNKKSQQTYKPQFEEKPASKIDYSENITEDMNWKEKFQTFKETEEKGFTATEPDFSEDDLEGIFSEEHSFETAQDLPFSEEEIIDELGQIQPQEQSNSGFENIQDYSLNEETEASIDELFAETDEEFIEQRPYAQTYEPEQIQEEEQGEEEFVKSEYVIDEERGLYLVDFEDKTALVGHIGEDIFVLKNFDEKIDTPIQARLNEKKGSNANYMTKVGGFKGIVEVSPDNMKLLIEL